MQIINGHFVRGGHFPVLMTSEYLQYMNLQSLGLLVTIAGMVIIRKSTSSILSLYKSPVPNFMYIQLSLCWYQRERKQEREENT